MALPFIFATTPAGNVPASEIDTNLTFLESQGVQGLTTTGSSNAYAATPADAWTTGYSQYPARALTIIPNFTNTGVSSLNVSSLGSVDIYKNVAGVVSELAAGDLVHNIPAIVICDGVNFLLANPSSQAQTVLQRVSAAFFSVATGTTVVPFDNTKPQNTEGDQYMTATITPKSSTSTLVIETVAVLSSSVSSSMQGSIFRDSGADSLGTTTADIRTSGATQTLVTTTQVTSGSTSPTTFNFRAGGNTANTTTFNGSGGNQAFGGAAGSRITITEFA